MPKTRSQNNLNKGRNNPISKYHEYQSIIESKKNYY